MALAGPMSQTMNSNQGFRGPGNINVLNPAPVQNTNTPTQSGSSRASAPGGGFNYQVHAGPSGRFFRGYPIPEPAQTPNVVVPEGDSSIAGGAHTQTVIALLNHTPNVSHQPYAKQLASVLESSRVDGEVPSSLSHLDRAYLQMMCMRIYGPPYNPNIHSHNNADVRSFLKFQL